MNMVAAPFRAKIARMQAIYHVIHPDGTIDTDEVEWPPRPGRHAIETLLGPLLGGEPLEHVAVLFDGEQRDMFVSELGLAPLTTRAPLPDNPLATTIFRANVLTRYPDTDPDGLPGIAGVAVLFVNRLVWGAEGG
jgi:hypothetical protein